MRKNSLEAAARYALERMEDHESRNSVSLGFDCGISMLRDALGVQSSERDERNLNSVGFLSSKTIDASASGCEVPIELEASERLGDYWQTSDGVRYPMYHVCVAGELEKLARGRTVDAAVNELMRLWSELFPNGIEGVKVVYIGKAAR